MNPLLQSVKNKTLYLLLFTGLLSLYLIPACTRQSPAPESIDTTKTLPGETPDPDKEVLLPQKLLLPLELSSSGITIKLKYMGNQPLLTELNTAEGLLLKISYDATGHPDGIISSKGGKLYGIVTYVKEPGGQVYKVDRELFINKGSGVVPDGHTLISYNEKNQIILVRDYNKNNLLTTEKIWSYSAGNLSSIIIKGTDNYQVNYTYDNKNGIFKHLPYADLVFLETTNSDMWPGINNLKGQLSAQMPAIDKKISYKYNTDGYPAEMTTNKGNKNETVIVTYKTLTP